MFKVEFLRFIKNPMNLFFSLVFPIGLMILFGQIFDSNAFQSNFIAVILLSTVSVTIIPIAINVALDKIGKRTKHYAIIEGASIKYIGSIYFTNFIISEITVILLIFIGVFGYNAEVSTPNIFILIFGPPLSFTLGFSIGILFAKYTPSFGVVLPLANVSFFIVLFISGMTVPLQVLVPDYFYYIQVLTPQGIMIMLYNHFTASAMSFPPGAVLPSEATVSILNTVQLAIAGVLLFSYTTALVSWASVVIFKNKII